MSIPRRRALPAAFACLLLVPGAASPPPADGAVSPRSASSLRSFDQLNAVGGSLTYRRRGPDRRRGVVRASYRGGGSNGFSRGVFDVRWRPGARVVYSARFYLPRGFRRRIQGQVDILRWDTWPGLDRSGISIYGSDKRARLVRQRVGVEQVAISRPFRLPEGRWFRLTVAQRLARRGARNTVYLNGRRIGSSRTRNTYGQTVQRMRYGIVAVAAGAQRRGLHLYFDDARVRRGR